ncbi:hypothetical protein [Pontibacter ruber]|uniref:Uncharacterized protein n=1 Tax=Pontibacter ruber TaxID=1343895 RepID=A0ABW5CY48_9BACT|nr:hypothetical protein [Pontibacter ruber]
MPTHDRYFKAEDFLTSLDTANLSGAELAKKLEDEINRNERLKIALVDEELNTNPESVVLIVNDIDSYVFVLQEVLAGLKADNFSNEVLSSARVSQIRNQILRLISKDI